MTSVPALDAVLSATRRAQLSSFFSSNYIQTMASLLSGATKTAHHLATSLLSAAEAKVGSTIPVKVPVKEDDAQKTFTFEGIKGKNIFVRP